MPHFTVSHILRQSYRLSVTQLHAASLCKTAELIELLFVVETLGDLTNIIVDGSSDFHYEFDAAISRLL